MLFLLFVVSTELAFGQLLSILAKRVLWKYIRLTDFTDPSENIHRQVKFAIVTGIVHIGH